ncbi:hypothetical protein DAPPUDRAFT_111440 [Daphnia pulex]|uniref:Uncharacterized protein n=1 Tax=Daphnia pulex TaxID=6669 RepID=E9H963_DAPPU|nr:hypothetical protein DAPPUDRAFT_111440 [Daphnia pulex]|eukprot:EFX71738.1 hypothetical protein DAPPUDRAFT_111440 [Daphnia pulex]
MDLSEFRLFIEPGSLVEETEKSVKKLAICMLGEDGFAEVKTISAERKAKTLARTGAFCEKSAKSSFVTFTSYALSWSTPSMGDTGLTGDFGVKGDSGPKCDKVEIGVENTGDIGQGRYKGDMGIKGEIGVGDTGPYCDKGNLGIKGVTGSSSKFRNKGGSASKGVTCESHTASSSVSASSTISSIDPTKTRYPSDIPGMYNGMVASLIPCGCSGYATSMYING